MGTQIKGLETTASNLTGDKHHLVAEVDKLRDQRSRLEKVQCSSICHKKTLNKRLNSKLNSYPCSN